MHIEAFSVLSISTLMFGLDSEDSTISMKFADVSMLISKIDRE